MLKYFDFQNLYNWATMNVKYEYYLCNKLSVSGVGIRVIHRFAFGSTTKAFSNSWNAACYII